MFFRAVCHYPRLHVRPFFTFRRTLDRTSLHRPLYARPWFVALALLPLAASAAWYWYTYNTFPPEARRPLRIAMVNHYYSDAPEKAIEYYEKAIEMCQQCGLSPNSAEVTGIKLRLAELYELKLNRPLNAIRTFMEVLGPYGSVVQGDEKEKGTRLKKAVGIAQRIGDICRGVEDWEGAETFYEWSVKTMLGLHQDPPRYIPRNLETSAGERPPHVEFLSDAELYPHTQQSHYDAPPNPVNTTPPAPQKNLQHAPWASPSDLGASLEALAGVYAIKGWNDLALSLYFRALNLLPADTSLARTTRTCRQAIVSNNIAESFASLGRVPEAEEWARKALKDADSVPNEECSECAAVVECNLGMITEMKGEFKDSIKHYLKCRERSANIKFLNGVRMAREGLDRSRSKLRDTS
ncbi:uncharacterized protein SPPG_04723 [Spizellomyces punctatus DAOM BR117]|uniref:TPR-like protein n=1 Tax=Spizellomyces punctatus (strain DAOM BR117) TaxID=645134 RepID=A0A0L0HHQ9_SPIPD|nr:uncharacterized protein SPPG_04723 [Spizellomyces punctatus DAOM BR117]KND00400.1 hypothetical protein SPPG_04723 [Spizellomyces punctatus DAOM BR117]|eukprot:XP_016608439.1 hypothetical protein SPPG_04723 [Spizellomyces punctatus DAOM BR117]